MTNVAYLILAHNTPHHLQRLIAALAAPSASFFVHVDKKAEMRPFSNVAGDNVFFAAQRVPVYWGEFSMVEATLTLMRQALAESRCDYLLLLSGSDYPLRSSNYIQQYLAQRRGMQFINLVKLPCAEASKSLARLERYVPRSDRPSARAAPQTPRRYEDHLDGLVPYGGSQWWALTRKACRFVLEFTRRRPDIVEFFENTRVPDEMFFHTILGNSPFRESIGPNVTYADWSDPRVRPELITHRHIEMFASCDALVGDGVYGRGEFLFARKYPDDSSDLVNAVDEMIRRKEGG